MCFPNSFCEAEPPLELWCVRQSLCSLKLILFINYSVAQREINERTYWPDLLAATDYLTTAQAASLHTDATELLKLLTSILKTAKSNIEPNVNY